MYWSIGTTRRIGNLADRLNIRHAGRGLAPDNRGTHWEDHAIGRWTGGLHRVLVHPPDIAKELYIKPCRLAGSENGDI